MDAIHRYLLDFGTWYVNPRLAPASLIPAGHQTCEESERDGCFPAPRPRLHEGVQEALPVLPGDVLQDGQAQVSEDWASWAACCEPCVCEKLAPDLRKRSLSSMRATCHCCQPCARQPEEEKNDTARGRTRHPQTHNAAINALCTRGATQKAHRRNGTHPDVGLEQVVKQLLLEPPDADTTRNGNGMQPLCSNSHRVASGLMSRTPRRSP